MKLKFKQRIAIKYYQAKFKTISILSKKKAAQSLFTFFCTPYSGKPKRKAPLIFKKAKPLNIIYNNLKMNGWHWQPLHSNNKKVLVLHGFDSCTYKSEAIITKLIDEGFEVFAFDALGHGISGGKTLNARLYSECIDVINKKFGEMYALVGHSIGGLAASLAVENYIPNLQKLVLIAPATETTRAIDNFFILSKMPIHLKEEMKNVITEMSGGKDPAYFSVNRVMEIIKTDTLWIHDKKDFICPIEDVLPIEQKQLSHIKFYFTNRLGHNLIYRSNDVLEKIVSFLK